MISIIIRVNHIISVFIMNFSSRLTLSLALSTGCISGAQSEQDSLHTLDNVVVTGTRTPKLLKDSPVSIDLITSKQLEVLSSGTLAEVLNFIPGVTVQRSAKDGYNVQLQGFTGDRVLVLVDGQRLITPTGSSVDLDQVGSLDIERIEIMRGAGSVLYGSAAMGGVINIITKSIDSMRSNIGYEVGSFSENATDEKPLEHRFSLNTVKNSEDLKTRLSYQFLDRPGFKYDHDSRAEVGTRNEKHFLEGSAEVKTFMGDFSYQAEYLKEDKLRPEGSQTIPGSGTIDVDYFSNVNRIDQKFTFKANDLFKINGSYALHNEESGRTIGTQREALLGVGGLGMQVISMLDSVEVVSGLEYEFESMDIEVDGISNEYRDSAQAYTQLDWFLTDHIELLAGLRVQQDSGFGVHHAARVSAKLQSNFSNGSSVQTRIGLGQSYKVPTLKQLHYVFDHSSIGYVVIGNEELKPEEAISFNFGTTFENAKGFSLELSGYYTEAEDLIENQFSTDPQYADDWGPLTQIYVYQNISKAEIRGGDFSIEAPLSSDQNIGVSYGVIEARDENGDRLLERPRHQVKLNYQASLNWMNTDLIAYAVYQADEAYDASFDAEHNNEWVSFNLSVTQQPMADLTLRYGIQNLFDEHENVDVQDFDAREKDSRRIYLGVSYKL